MTRFVVTRLLLVVPMLFGISAVTFLLMELAPGNAVTIKLEKGGGGMDARVRAERAHRLRVQHGMIDAETGESVSAWLRYGRWLENAVRFRFAGDVAGSARFRDRILRALPTTLLLNSLGLLLAFGLAIPAAARAGFRGGVFDRILNSASFLVLGTPEFLMAMLLMLVFCGGFLPPMLPSAGLGSPGASQMGVFERSWDLLQHLCLPVLCLGLYWGATIFRFLRHSVQQVKESDFVTQLRLFGASEARIQRRVVRNGLSPVVTLSGGMLPALVGGTIVVERMFSLQGLGMLTTTAVTERDMPMVMALTMLVSVFVLLGLLIADILQRVVDPRVVLR